MERQTHDPRDEYRRRLNSRLGLAALEESRHVRLGNARLAVAAAAAVLAWLAFVSDVISPAWLLAPLAGFAGLAVIHERVLKARRRAQRAAAFYDLGVARLEDRWAGKGEPGTRFHDENHPYAGDLDLFGRGSLFELLSAARTRAGEATLAAWLLSPADPAEVLSRQAAVLELEGRLDLREELSLLGDEMGSGVNAEALAEWGERPPLLDSRAARIGAACLVALLVAGIIVWRLFDMRLLFITVAAIEAGFARHFRAKVLRVIEAVHHPAHDLELLSEVLIRLERERFQSPRLANLRARLDTDGQPPSKRIAGLRRLTDMLDSRDNVAVRIIGPPLLWTTQVAFAVEAWRKSTGPALRGWLEAVGEMEALSSLAGYAWEHPADPFPSFHGGTEACLSADGIAHPLLPESRAVRNDLHLGVDRRVLIVSGSNMSGKSTLLRTVGINAVLAMAGGTVRARRMVLAPMAVGASIRVLDSLQSGTSRFYAEIQRLRRLLDLAGGPLPLLFLLDELLHGTNSHDRKIGAEAVVRGFVSRGAVGLVTTHDLALAHIAEMLAPHAANVHFEDHLEAGQMRFDFKLRDGVVHKSNALELMRSVGLEV